MQPGNKKVEKLSGNGKRIFIDIQRCMGCKACEMACIKKHSGSNGTDIGKRNGDIEGISRIKITKYKTYALPLQCRQCPEPYCYFACIAGAIKIEDGNMIFDEDKCTHCYSCVMSCPYGVMHLGEDVSMPAVRCDLCPDEKIPPCVVSCPTRTLFFGNQQEFKKLLKGRKEKCTT
ncbi:MAG: 4Fe-4S binding protein [Candidatus Omnitrophica bacterium]|nr:4Fe-4S binding protein [Candidatus Omnitrophota bacterium]